MSEQDKRDVHELRMLVEIPAMVRLAGHPALRNSEGSLREIASENIAAACDGDLVAYLDSDMRFHLGLLQLFGNDRLTTLTTSLRDQTRRAGLNDLVRSGTLLRTAQEHLFILDALLDNDSARVRDLMITHLSHIIRDWGPADLGAREAHRSGRQAAAPAST
jgi:DNA-binding GntR family transcriptional regulator